MTAFFTHWLTQDVLLILGLGGIVFGLTHAARSERWQRAWTRFCADRTGIVALSVVCVYLFIGASETLRVPVGGGATKSLLDFAVASIPEERSYSAPFGDRVITDTKPKPDPLN